MTATEVDLDDPQLGTIGDRSAARCELSASPAAVTEPVLGWRYRCVVMRTMSGNLPKNVHWDAGVGHPSKSGVPEIMAA